MIGHEEARERGLGPFRGLVILALPVAVVWTPIIALLISRAT